MYESIETGRGNDTSVSPPIKSNNQLLTCFGDGLPWAKAPSASLSIYAGIVTSRQIFRAFAAMFSGKLLGTFTVE